MTQLRDLRYVRATDLAQAEDLLAGGPADARAYAGGTDLLGVLKDGVHAAYPGTVVDLKGIPGLAAIAESGEGGLQVGALVTLSRLERDPLVRERYPLLAQAAAAVAAPQLKNMGTVGGNLCQEPRCWYYRHPEDTFHCARKGGPTCNAFTGEHRFHSIFGSVKIGTRPCSVACPGGVHIPEYQALVRAGALDDASTLLLERNPLPAITGRVCPHYCENDCNRGRFDEAVSVRAVERYLGDHVLAHAGRFMGPPPAETGRRVAVVGSGPAGLSAAFYLRRRGHGVTVFEREPEPGGMLRYAIPGYRLPLSVLERTIAALSAMGIEFRPGVDVGVDVTLAELRQGYSAVFLAPGAWGQPRLGLEHEDLLQSGLDLLRRVRSGERPPVGHRVVVIGGGNVAVDVAVAARRLGAESVTMVFLETCDEMPAFPREVEQARAEGVETLESCGPARIRTDETGRLVGLELQRCVCVFDEAGRFAPAFDETDTSSIEADQVILAIGQRVEVGDLAVEGLLGDAGRLAAAQESGATDLSGVYAGGDAVTGPASVIAALAAGRRAATAIHADLAHPGAAPATIAAPGEGEGRLLEAFSPSCLVPSLRSEPLELAVGERTLDRPDAPEGLTLTAMAAEVERCFNCGCVAVTPSDLAPALVALDAEIVSTRRVIPAPEFFAARECSSTVLAPGELVTAIRLPAPRGSTRSTYEKFRLRQAIDFPILGVACVLDVVDGTVCDAALVLGAAAPVPVRAAAAEAYLEGRPLTPETIAEASRLSTEGCMGLPSNGYKVQVARALVGKVLARLAY